MINVRKYVYMFIISFVVLMGPFLLQIANTPDGYTSTGFFAGGIDYPTFITKMKWGMEGNWTYENRFTDEITEAVPMYQFYLFLGHLAGWLGIPLYWVFHLARSILGALTVVLLWRFVKNYIPVNPYIAFILAIFTSGGYLTTAELFLDTDMGNLDLFLQGRIWLSYLTYPHYVLQFLAVLLLLESYLATKTTLLNQSLLAFVGGVLISLVHPFLLGLFCPVILLSSIFRKDYKKALTSCALASIGALPIMVPLYIALKNVEWLNIWREQTYASTPAFWNFFILAYGFTGLLGWYGFVKWLKNRENIMVVWATWLVLAVILSYAAPFPNKREFAFYLSLPLAIFAAPWVEMGIRRFQRNCTGIKKIIGPILLILVCIWQSIALYIDCMIPYKLEITNDYYISQEYQEAFQTIDEIGGDLVILSPYWLGNLIPAHTKSRPYVGHVSETQNFKEKKDKSDAFFKGELTKSEMQELLTKNNISLVMAEKLPYVTDILGEPYFNGEEVCLWKNTL